MDSSSEQHSPVESMMPESMRAVVESIPESIRVLLVEHDTRDNSHHKNEDRSYSDNCQYCGRDVPTGYYMFPHHPGKTPCWYWLDLITWDTDTYTTVLYVKT